MRPIWKPYSGNCFGGSHVRGGQQALDLVAQQPDIDLILSDIQMPGMDGLTLLARLSVTNPIIRTVMVTAYGDMDNPHGMNRGRSTEETGLGLSYDIVTKGHGGSLTVESQEGAGATFVIQLPVVLSVTGSILPYTSMSIAPYEYPPPKTVMAIRCPF